MAFDWDPYKNAANIERHGIDFEDARRIFEGPVVEARSRREYSEVRMIAIGLLNDREIVVVYTWRGDKRRLISARRASRNERREYQRAIQGGHN